MKKLLICSALVLSSSLAFAKTAVVTCQIPDSATNTVSKDTGSAAITYSTCSSALQAASQYVYGNNSYGNNYTTVVTKAADNSTVYQTYTFVSTTSSP